MLTPDVQELSALLERGDAKDRAFVDAMIRIGFARASGAGARTQLLELHAALQAAALSAHAALRAQVARASLSPAALRRLVESVPALERDHFVEEMLGIAYPPLEEPEPVPELIAYTPSGYDEIAHAIEATGIGPGDCFLDVGSGLGKAVMLVALLTGALSHGVERDPALHARAESAALALGLRDVRFQQADAREMVVPNADVVFMFLPFTGKTLARVLERLLAAARTGKARAGSRFLCSAALDLGAYPDFAPVGPTRSWMQVYAWR